MICQKGHGEYEGSPTSHGCPICARNRATARREGADRQNHHQARPDRVAALKALTPEQLDEHVQQLLTDPTNLATDRMLELFANVRKADQIRVCLWMPVALHRALVERSERDKRSMASLIRLAAYRFLLGTGSKDGSV